MATGWSSEEPNTGDVLTINVIDAALSGGQTGTVSGAGATVTMSLGVSLNGSVTALISGIATANDALTISVFDAGLSGGQRDFSYTVLPSDTLATITSALAAAINADSQLRLIGVKASASSTKLTVTSVSTNDTTYLPSKSAGATETILWGLPANGTVTASVAGAITAGDIVTITVFDARFERRLRIRVPHSSSRGYAQNNRHLSR